MLYAEWMEWIEAMGLHPDLKDAVAQMLDPHTEILATTVQDERKDLEPS